MSLLCPNDPLPVLRDDFNLSDLCFGDRWIRSSIAGITVLLLVEDPSGPLHVRYQE
jgi:hypothetical protein